MAIIDAIRNDGMDHTETPFALQENPMTLLLLEALGALLLLVFIVWWTMFSGRKKGELGGDSVPPAANQEADKK